MRKSLLQGGRYTPSAQTDLKKTFARLRREKTEAAAQATWEEAYTENRARNEAAIKAIWDEAHAEYKSRANVHTFRRGVR